MNFFEYQVHNVDEVLERHNDFLESCLGDCMLTSPQLLKAVTTLCLVCVQFCTFIQVTRYTRLNKGTLNHHFLVFTGRQQKCWLVLSSNLK